jgi:outer membrane autotransporter protein
MKNILIASLFALATVSVHATEVGTNVARDYSGADRNAFGITVGKQLGVINTTLGLSREYRGANDSTTLSLMGGYNVFKIFAVTLSVEAGTAYVRNQSSASGYALVGGVGAQLPLTKTVSLTADITRQYGQSRIKDSNGNNISVGMKYNF